MSTRRDFIKATSLITVGTMLMPSCKLSNNSIMKPGLQTYSIRNQLKSDFEGTMKYIAEVGYQHIEAYGLGGDGSFLKKISPKHYAQVINDLGMDFKATHCTYLDANEADKMIEAAAGTGMEYMVVPWVGKELRSTVDGWKMVANNLNRLGEKCLSAGLKLGYHNHDFEFEKLGDLIPIELLIDETEKDLVNFELDLFWSTKGGYNPIDLINKFPGRISLFHVKDATAQLEGTTAGQGIIDFESIFKAGKKDVLEYYFVEDERTDSPFDNIKADYEFVAEQRFMR